MDIFIKSTIGTLIAVILYLILGKQGKDISTLLTVAVCCMLVSAAIECLKPVIDFVERLSVISNLDSQMLQVVLRSVGIGLLAEITSLIYSDAGNAAMGKALQFLAGGVVLWLSLPILTQLIDLIEDVLKSV